MQRTRLHNTDLEVSRICLGTMTFGGQTDEQEAERMIALCLDEGVNFIDTANVYNHGESELMLGGLLRGRRQQFVLASKVRGKMGEGPDESGLSRAAIFRAIDESLRRLRTDHLDIYYLHQPDPAVPVEETLEAMDAAVRQGKVRYPATSNYAAWQVCHMIGLAEKHDYRPAWIAQPMYNLLARRVEQEFTPMARALGVSTVVYNPLAGGLLTGKHRAGERPAPGTRFDANQMYLDRYWHPVLFDAVEDLRRAADSAGRSLVSFSLNWLLHHSAADCIILGASRADQLRENLAAVADGPLPSEAITAADSAWSRLRGAAPNYNR